MPALWPLDPSTYARHALHHGERVWPESNCYVDLWIELLHTGGFEPLADLLALYGIDVIELNIWSRLVDHIERQLLLGRPAIVEVDAFYLPDTAGSSYRTEHVKTTVAIQSLESSRQRLGYFHNAGYYELEGDDYAGIFHAGPAAAGLPPYVELAKLPARPALAGRALAARSLALLRGHLERRPAANPFRRYAAQCALDLATVSGGGLHTFHAYAFATFRQCGSAFELGAAYLRWLQGNGVPGLDDVASACDAIAAAAKALQFKAARAVSLQRGFDPTPLLDEMSRAWDHVMTGLDARVGALAQTR
jgi:hypothetical protein